jgi:hypothetical protein
VDLAELKKSALVSGAFDLLTCGCGSPECAGFWEPIFVQHSNDIVWWEFDSRYHPIVQKGDDLEFSVTRYEFDRKQYVTEIREKFIWLRSHPRKHSIGPHGFNTEIIDNEFPESLSVQLPFNKGETIVVGYFGEYQQPWIWIDEKPDAHPRQLIPTGGMWANFGNWSLMWDSDNSFGKCEYRKEGAFQLRVDVSILECNEDVESLAREIQAFWGDEVLVRWEKVSETTPRSHVRCYIAAK